MADKRENLKSPKKILKKSNNFFIFKNKLNKQEKKGFADEEDEVKRAKTLGRELWALTFVLFLCCSRNLLDTAAAALVFL
jgi:hypothetical protein